MNKKTDFENIVMPADASENLPDCDELENEFADFFEYLHAVSDAENDSLENLLDTAIGEEEKFLEWRNSRRSLKNVQIFHKKDDARFQLKKPKFPFFGKTFETKIDVALDDVGESSRLEIWECGKDQKPYFPLLRLFFSKIRTEGELFVKEKLRDDYALNIRAEKTDTCVSFTVSLFNPAGETSLAAKIGGFIAEYQKLWQSVFAQYKRCFASLILLAFVGTSLLTGIACSNNQRVFAGIKSEQGLSRNFEERFGDEKISQFLSFAQRLTERPQNH